MTSFDTLWHRIVTLQGETFYQKRGQPFRYRVSGNKVVPSTTNRQLPRSHFARAYQRSPIGWPRPTPGSPGTVLPVCHPDRHARR
jgi:hypothetical protein